MKLKENILAGLGKRINLMNTLEGGIAMTSVKFYKKNNAYMAVLRNPAFAAENYYLEINPNSIMVYGNLYLEKGHGIEEEYVENTEILPAFMQHIPIPREVDIEKIEAVFEEGELKIIAPIQQDFRDYPKPLNIKSIE